METVTYYGVIRSRQNASSSTTPEHHSDEKENEVRDATDKGINYMTIVRQRRHSTYIIHAQVTNKSSSFMYSFIHM